MDATFTCAAEADTRAVGRRLASLLRAGDIVLLAGDLGAGKTVFASGIAEGLGVQDPVVSPSFVLVRRYGGLMSMIHADLYRLGSSGEIEDLDLGSEAAEGILVVEWGDVSEQSFGDDHLMVTIIVDDEGVRTVRLRPRGSWESRRLPEGDG
ncbi:MAG: tRNA (adenosine(37)-N6)-threonylcarbamoyltransferase complex ATPase subunit type 1 TsaE [Actinobacteria bacterium]|nr:tRNA (adenosine(37)-N6)-threonylcarbamoyltransferase complex ATPase subunit type 1 TsaE [Actinomycetota bacterium]MBU1493296.1 tRNA (adenosine(37)-N6)-threonylcarbamoyltransferase complex ATPase subunit type 1 TsaE [Actinomycetota bacterium]MBU1866829.1 tRNA (adenosine(37)-N6)-threonylcarbamoyltransferase complex ATPase subunit type 1 TsaE [Actinomycetota bacterium]